MVYNQCRSGTKGKYGFYTIQIPIWSIINLDIVSTVSPKLYSNSNMVYNQLIGLSPFIFGAFYSNSNMVYNQFKRDMG